jgi:hypothetical protein
MPAIDFFADPLAIFFLNFQELLDYSKMLIRWLMQQPWLSSEHSLGLGDGLILQPSCIGQKMLKLLEKEKERKIMTLR